MKPYPLASSNHFTVPVAIYTHLLSTHHERAEEGTGRSGTRSDCAERVPAKARRGEASSATVAARLGRRPRLRHVRQQRHLSRTLDRHGQLPLVPPTRPGDPRRADLASLRDEPPQLTDVLV